MSTKTSFKFNVWLKQIEGGHFDYSVFEIRVCVFLSLNDTFLKVLSDKDKLLKKNTFVLFLSENHGVITWMVLECESKLNKDEWHKMMIIKA